MQESKEYLSEETLKEMIKKYEKVVYSIALNVLGDFDWTDDVVQEVFIQCYYVKPEMAGWSEAKQLSYIKIVARNIAINYYRKRKKEKLIYLEDVVQEDQQLGRMDERPSDNYVLEAMNRLPETYRDLFLMRYKFDLTDSEIAQTLQMKETAIRKRFSRGRRILKELLEVDVL